MKVLLISFHLNGRIVGLEFENLEYMLYDLTSFFICDFNY